MIADQPTGREVSLLKGATHLVSPVITSIIMSTAAEKKQEADFTSEVDALVPKVEALAKGGKLQEGLEQIYTLEKKARNAADLASTTRLLLLILHLLRTTPSPTSPDWKQLNEAIVSLSRKHGQLKQAITRMVGAAMCYLHAPGIGESGVKEEEKEVEMQDVEAVQDKSKSDKEKNGEASSTAKDEKTEKMKKAVEEASEDKGEGKENEKVRELMDRAKAVGNTGVTEAMRLQLVETIRQVTEGKIFVEVARARSTLVLAQMLEKKGNIAEAADKLGELAVETFGSMDRREKHEIIMEQMRLYMERKDWARMGIVGKKINTKFFNDEKQHDLKLRFYNLMIAFSLDRKSVV